MVNAGFWEEVNALGTEHSKDRSTLEYPLTVHKINKITTMTFLGFLGWFALNVLVPLFTSVALLMLVGLGHGGKKRANKLVKESMQDGQLFWTVIAMAAAACYEAGAVLSKKHDDTSFAIGILSFAFHGLLIVLSAGSVLIGTLDAENKQAHQTTQQIAASAGKLPTIMVASLWTAGITAVTYSVTHIWAA